MRRSVIFFICVVVLCPSCYEPGDIGLFLRKLSANPNPFCIADNILESGWIFGRRGDWESILSYTHSGVLSVYLFKQEDVDNLGWKYLSEHNGYLVRYDLRLDDLRSLKDNLYYPPTMAMRNIHMFPPYEKVKAR